MAVIDYIMTFAVGMGGIVMGTVLNYFVLRKLFRKQSQEIAEEFIEKLKELSKTKEADQFREILSAISEFLKSEDAKEITQEIKRILRSL